jgi:polar amino acid transport system substrate-binding protein
VLSKHPAIEPEQKFQLMSSPDHIALNKGEPAFKQMLNDVVAKMRADGSLDKISQQWLGKPLDPKDLM